MSRTSNVTRQLMLAAALVATFAMAGCDSTTDRKPTTASTAAAKPAKPVVPKPDPLPPGLSTSALNDFETSTSAGPLDSLFDLNRPEGAAPPVRVALLLPLSGTASGAGRIMLEAAQLALFDANEPRLMLMPHDTQSTSEGATAAAQAALADGANLVLGPLFGAHVQPVAQVVSPRGVPVLAFSNDQNAAGGGAAVLGLTPEAEIQRIIQYAHSQGLTQIAAFLPDSAYGLLIADRLTQLAPLEGVIVERITHYPNGAEASDELLLQAAREFASYDQRRAELQRERARLKSRNDAISERALKRLETLDTLGDPPYQAVLLGEPGRRLPTIAPLLAFYDVDPTRVQLLGLSNWYGAGLGSEPSLIGAWFTGPDPTQYEQLMRRYQSIFNGNAHQLVALTYDAVAVAADMASKAPDNGRIDTARLLAPGGYDIYFGPFRINRSGTTDRMLSILRVESEGLTVVEVAPVIFTNLTN